MSRAVIRWASGPVIRARTDEVFHSYEALAVGEAGLLGNELLSKFTVIVDAVAGRLILSGDRGPMFSHSYVNLTLHRLFSDGRNEPRSNYAPRTLGSSASRMLQMLPFPSSDRIEMSPRRESTLRATTSSPTPRPDTSVTFSAVAPPRVKSGPKAVGPLPVLNVVLCCS